MTLKAGVLERVMAPCTVLVVKPTWRELETADTEAVWGGEGRAHYGGLE